MASTTQTRSGRISKPPTRYEPVEQVEDDYASDDYDNSESEIGSCVSYSEEELDEDDDSSLEDFIEDDEDESDKSEDEVETSKNGRRSAAAPIPVKKRGVPAASGARRPRGQSASPRQPHAFPADAQPPAASA
jgi:hypothetical protein